MLRKSSISFLIRLFLLSIIPTAVFLASCGSSTGDAESGEDLPQAIELTSPAFDEGSPIPRQYTCDGEDISPPLQWSNLPAETSSVALIMDDPDAPVNTWVHWVLYNLPGDSTGLPEDVALADSGDPANNSWNRSGYGGPCPPRGSHRYFFKIYALDSQLTLDPEAEKEDLLEAMESHILDQAQLMGTYEREE